VALSGSQANFLFSQWALLAARPPLPASCSSQQGQAGALANHRAHQQNEKSTNNERAEEATNLEAMKKRNEEKAPPVTGNSEPKTRRVEKQR